MNDPTDHQLSPDGEARRTAMLQTLTTHLHRIHRRRRWGHQATAALALLVLGFAYAWVTGSDLSGSRGGQPGPGDIALGPPRVTVIHHAPRTGLIRTVDDDDLVQVLHEIGRPAGLIRLDHQTRLTTAVTDAKLKLNRPPPPSS